MVYEIFIWKFLYFSFFCKEITSILVSRPCGQGRDVAMEGPAVVPTAGLDGKKKGDRE